jgi:soluble lytic murein transglycosylase-like protein
MLKLPKYLHLGLFFNILFIWIGYKVTQIDYRIGHLEQRMDKIHKSTAWKLYEGIDHYSDSFGVPKHIAFNIAYQETGYRGPFDIGYNPRQTSFAGAVGPMQIIPKYGAPFAGRTITGQELMDNPTLSAHLSMKILRYWYDRFGDWVLACGAYNSGKPIRNQYAVNAVQFKNYKERWVKL